MVIRCVNDNIYRHEVYGGREGGGKMIEFRYHCNSQELNSHKKGKIVSFLKGVFRKYF